MKLISSTKFYYFYLKLVHMHKAVCKALHFNWLKTSKWTVLEEGFVFLDFHLTNFQHMWNKTKNKESIEPLLPL